MGSPESSGSWTGSPWETAERTVALWCPDWPVVAAAAAASLPPHLPVAVLGGGVVVSCSATARASGVRHELRRREAQGRCPELTVVADDPGRDATFFEPVVAAVEALAPGVEVLHPGLVALASRGPTRYFGSEREMAERLTDVVAAEAGVESQVGVADGLFAAMLAAQRGLLVTAGETVEFLASLGISELTQPAVSSDTPARAELVGLLHRLGLRTLGAFAALPVDDVASRFGPDGIRAHRLARGLAERPLARRRPPTQLAVTQRLDPPVERVDAAAFAVREPAERLHELLVRHGLACTRLAVGARTASGEELVRVWRCAEPLSATGIADRLRWQLDGWLSSRSGGPTAGVIELRLVPEEVVGGSALQRGLWGESGEADDRAGRALVRVQGLLGVDAVVTGVLGGGRDPAQQVRLVPWGDEQVPTRPAQPPWPGQLPAPSPSTVPPQPLAAEVLDTAGVPVRVEPREALSSAPHRVAVEGRSPRRVLAWAGPWPVEDRWWDPQEARQRMRLQVVIDDEPFPSGHPAEPSSGSAAGSAAELALLLSCEADRWQVEGIYE